MFSGEFAFCLFISYARICTFIRRHLKETVLYGKITWSAMRKQNLQLKRSIDRRPISSNSGYNSNPSFFLLFKSVFLNSFPYPFESILSNLSELAFYAFMFEFKFRNSLGFSSPRFEQPGIGAKKVSPKTVSF